MLISWRVFDWDTFPFRGLESEAFIYQGFLRKMGSRHTGGCFGSMWGNLQTQTSLQEPFETKRM